MKFEKLLAHRYIKAQKRQSVFTVISIAAAVAVMAMFFLLYAVLVDGMRNVKFNTAPYHVAIYDLTEEQGMALQDEPYVESVKLENGMNSGVTAYVMFNESCGDQAEWAQNVASDLGIKGQLSCEWNSSLMDLDLVSDSAHLKRLQMFSAVFIIVLLIAVALRMVIDTAFEISSKEREKQYGVLQSVGATPKQIVNIITSESLVLCVIGIPLGIVLGIFFAYGMYRAVLNNGISDLIKGMAAGKVESLVPFRIDPLMLLVAAVTGVAWVFFSAYGVGMRIVRKTPIEAITVRSNKVEKVAKHPLLGVFFGVSGRMASRNAKRQKKRFIITVLTLTVSITLFGCFSSVMEYGRIEMKNLLELQTLNSDFQLDIEKDKVSDLEESGLFKDVGISDIKFVKLEKNSRESFFVEFMNKAAFDKLFEGSLSVSYEELVETGGFVVNTKGHNYDDYESMLADSAGSDIEGYAIKKTLEDDKKEYSDDMEKTAAAKSETVNVRLHIAEVASTAKNSLLLNGVFISPIENYDIWGENVGSFVIDKNHVNCTCSLVDANKYKEALKYLENNTSTIELLTDAYIERVNNNYLTSSVTAGVLFINVIIGIIALINLMNIISTSISNRRSELASLQCIGMTKAQLKRMTVLECLQFTMNATFISAILCSVVLIGMDSVKNIIFSADTMDPAEYEMMKSIFPKMNYTGAIVRIIAASLISFVTACEASFIMLRYQDSDSLTEQIRGSEMHVDSRNTHIIRNTMIAVIGAAVIIVGGLRIYSIAAYNHEKNIYKDAGYLNLVDAGGKKMNVYITGTENGRHTIVGIAGQGGGAFSIAAKSMTEILGQENKVVYPDRAGNGFSEDSHEPQTIECVVESYREGLKNAGVEAPYVLMAHSYGGMYATYWEIKYPDEVESVVYLDSYIPPKNEHWMMYESEIPSAVSEYHRNAVRHLFGLDRLSGRKSDDPIGTAVFSEEDVKLMKMTLGKEELYDIGTFAYASECLLMKQEDEKIREMLEPTDIPKLFISTEFTSEEDIREYYEFMKADYEAAGKEFENDPVKLARDEWRGSYRECQDYYLNTIQPFMERVGNCRCKSIAGEHAIFYAQKPQEVADTILDFLK